MSPQLVTAFLRSLYGGVLLGAAAALTAFQTGRGDAYQGQDTVIAFLVTFVGYLIFRGAAEGIIDTSRAAEVRMLNRLPLKSDIVVSDSTARALEAQKT